MKVFSWVPVVCFVVLCCEVKVSGTYVDVQKKIL